MSSAMVVSRDSRFLDCVGDALQNQGIWVVCIERTCTVAQVLRRGYRPTAVIIDPATMLEPGGGMLARYFAESAELADVPILSVSSAARRIELTDLIQRLRQLDRDGERAQG